MQDHITIIGLGSLIDEKSARRSCPNLTHFRFAKISGYKRVFNKADSFLMRKKGIPNNNKYACLSAMPDKAIDIMYVSTFYIPKSEWHSIVEREFDYKLVSIPYEEIDSHEKGEGIVCMGDFKDNQECEELIASDPVRAKRAKELRGVYEGPIWRDDLEPSPYYLNNCLRAVRLSRPEFQDNWLDTTFTGDGRSIREYLNN